MIPTSAGSRIQIPLPVDCKNEGVSERRDMKVRLASGYFIGAWEVGFQRFVGHFVNEDCRCQCRLKSSVISADIHVVVSDLDYVAYQMCPGRETTM